MQRGSVNGAYLFFLCSTAWLKRHHHKTPIKLFTFTKEKALYLNQIEMKFLEFLKAKHYFDKKTRLLKGRGRAGPTAHLQQKVRAVLLR